MDEFILYFGNKRTLKRHLEKNMSFKNMHIEYTQKENIYTHDSKDLFILVMGHPLYKSLKLNPDTISKLYKKSKIDFLKNTFNSFSIVIHDKNKESTTIIRDQLGISSIYSGINKKIFSSNKKLLFENNYLINTFPPGHYYKKGKYSIYYKFPFKENKYDSKKFKKLFEESMNSLHSFCKNKKIGVLLSGGIDSCAVAYHIKKKFPESIAFTVGIKNCNDIKSAKLFTKSIGMKHIVKEYTEKEAISYLNKVIKSIESWNYSLVRNSIPTLFAMKLSKENNVDIILTGDCADSILGGQKHLINLPDFIALQIERQEFSDLHTTELRRMQNNANTSNISVISPFLYLPFVEYAINLPFTDKLKHNLNNIHNKYPLRIMLEKSKLPKECIWRKKEPISEGSGLNFLKSYFDNKITDKEFSNKKKKYTPIKFISKEHLVYFEMWQNIFFQYNKNNYEECWKHGAYGRWEFYFT